MLFCFVPSCASTYPVVASPVMEGILGLLRIKESPLTAFQSAFTLTSASAAIPLNLNLSAALINPASVLEAEGSVASFPVDDVTSNVVEVRFAIPKSVFPAPPPVVNTKGVLPSPELNSNSPPPKSVM